MKIEHVKDKIRYTLSNESLKEGDEVFPIANGRCLDNGGWVLHGLDYEYFFPESPEEVHKIEDMKYSEYKPYQIKTDHGFGPIEQYFKIIKREKQIKVGKGMFPEYKWVEIKN